jgi:hypothetical protein
MNCPICHSNKTAMIRQRNSKTYYSCSVCEFIFLDPVFRLQLDKEKDRYLMHENSIENQDYVNFLGKMIVQLEQVTIKMDRENIKILDYGSGPVPILQKLLLRKNFDVDIYDPIFALNKSVFNKKFDVILLNEVIEHFFDPMSELNQIKNILVSNGSVLVQTQLHQGQMHFQDWWYARDTTHVSFFNMKTLEFCRSQVGFSSVQIFENGIIQFLV